jgi:hypothetical protein
MSIYLSFFETAWIVFQEQIPLFPEEARQLIRPGDHVAAKLYPNETLGVVVSIEDDEAYIRMPQWMIDRNYSQAMSEQSGYEEVTSLVRTEGYSIQELAGAIYGKHSFHHLYNVQRSYFDAWKHMRIRCQYEKCNEAAIGVGLINFLGSVMPFAMCPEHTEYHGMCCEHIPFTGKILEAEYA